MQNPLSPNRRFKRLLQGAGRFVANQDQQGCAHVHVLRAPVAHGDITRLDLGPAQAATGVIAALRAEDIDTVCAGWHARHGLFPQAQVPQERPLARNRVRFVGEAVALIIARTPAEAVAAAESVVLDITERPALVSPRPALDAKAARLHDDLPDNRYLHLPAMADPQTADATVSLSLSLARIGAQPLETRSIIADYDPIEDHLTVTLSHQHPHQMQDIYSRLLGIPEHRVRVICDDVGGAFGVKQQLYADEMAVVAAARLLGRRLRLVTSRSDSLISDAQSREHLLDCAARIDADSGRIAALSLSDTCAVGAFPHYPRTSHGESAQARLLLGAPYAIECVAAEASLAFQNKPPMGHYRGVGHPIGCLATEALMDACARVAGTDPITYRRRHLHDPEALPVTTATGLAIDRFRMSACLDALEERLAPWRDAEAPAGWLRGIGVACLVETCALGPVYYGDGDVRISVSETCTLRMEPSGVLRAATANTDQGQGADETIARVIAGVLDLPAADIEVTSGDSANTPYGGGAFASRGAAIGGAAAHDAATRLKALLLKAAGALLQCPSDALDLAAGAVIERDGGARRLGLPELAGVCHFKPYLLPDDMPAGLVVTGHNRPEKPFQICTAVFGAIVDVDPETGAVTPVRLIVAHDGGTLINPASVDAQLQGGAVQGLGHALMEAMHFDAQGQPLAGSWLDYAMPRAADAPLIDVVHLPPLEEDVFAPRGVGEAGISGTPAALFNAINDALHSHGAAISQLPATPEAIWQALQLAGRR